MAGTFPDTWSETALLTISRKGESVLDDKAVHFVTVTETIDIDEGDKPVESKATIKGGRVVKRNPQEDTTITLEAYPVSIYQGEGVALASQAQGGPGFDQWFHNPSSIDTSQPLSVSASLNRTTFRVAVLWTDDTSVLSATAATSADKVGLRYVLSNAYLTSVKKSFTDGLLKYTVKFMAPPFDKSGTSNITVQSTDGTSVLTALSAYS